MTVTPLWFTALSIIGGYTVGKWIAQSLEWCYRIYCKVRTKPGVR